MWDENERAFDASEKQGDTSPCAENRIIRRRQNVSVKAGKDDPDRLTDSMVKALPAPAKGNKINYDSEVKGFGVRVTSSGAKSFILNYRAAGRERRITIGSCSDWKTGPAREAAKALKRRIDVGEDPMADRHAERAAPTMNALADRFEQEHLTKKRAATQTDYKSILRLYVRPELGTTRVADLRHSDIERLHNRISKTAPYRANRTVAVLSKMLSLAVKWEYRTDNPARGIERAPEEKRERYLSPAEIERLAGVLLTHKERTTANAIRLLLLTGARRGETLGARWSEFDLQEGVWVKPSAHTKTAKLHRVPLSAPALLLLSEMKAEAERHLAAENTELAKKKKPLKQLEFVFPGLDGQPLKEPKRAWLSICRQAGLALQVPKLDAKGKPLTDKEGQPVMVWQPTVRLHDLRHTYASILASAGLSLPIIGRLLGHTQAATTQRYAHLMDDPLRAATERVGALVSGHRSSPVPSSGPHD
jgi:integrase